MPNLADYGRFLPLVGKLAAEQAIPAIGFGRTFVEAGGLLSYGPKEGEGQMAVAQIVHSILQGAKPGEIAVVHQRASSLAINSKAAAKLGVSVPSTLLKSADELVQ
jgi:putative ABC transport system substrate-binding protein